MEQITCAALLFIHGYQIRRQRLVWPARGTLLLLGEEYVYITLVTMVITINAYSTIVVSVVACTVEHALLRDTLCSVLALVNQSVCVTLVTAI